MICPHCSNDKVQKRGTNVAGTKQRYQCKKCFRYFIDKIEEKSAVIKQMPPAKILLFDIETLPMEVYVWSLRDNDYISPSNIKKDWCVLSWSAKWLYSDTVLSDSLTSHEAIKHEDHRLMKSIWELLNGADLVIGHNSDRFDHKKLNTRFLIHQMNRPMYYKTVDTLKVAKSAFAFSSNKLDYINSQLGIHQKSDTDLDLWKQCSEGDALAIRRMVNYNMNDVQILEELYVKLLPWISNHPSMKSYVDTQDDICPNCGNTDLNWGGYYRTNKSKYRAFRCNDCGAIGRSNKSS